MSANITSTFLISWKWIDDAIIGPKSIRRHINRNPAEKIDSLIQQINTKTHFPTTAVALKLTKAIQSIPLEPGLVERLKNALEAAAVFTNDQASLFYEQQIKRFQHLDALIESRNQAEASENEAEISRIEEEIVSKITSPTWDVPLPLRQNYPSLFAILCKHVAAGHASIYSRLGLLIKEHFQDLNVEGKETNIIYGLTTRNPFDDFVENKGCLPTLLYDYTGWTDAPSRGYLRIIDHIDFLPVEDQYLMLAFPSRRKRLFDNPTFIEKLSGNMLIAVAHFADYEINTETLSNVEARAAEKDGSYSNMKKWLSYFKKLPYLSQETFLQNLSESVKEDFKIYYEDSESESLTQAKQTLVDELHGLFNLMKVDPKPEEWTALQILVRPRKPTVHDDHTVGNVLRFPEGLDPARYPEFLKAKLSSILAAIRSQFLCLEEEKVGPVIACLKRLIAEQEALRLAMVSARPTFDTHERACFASNEDTLIQTCKLETLNSFFQTRPNPDNFNLYASDIDFDEAAEVLFAPCEVPYVDVVDEKGGIKKIINEAALRLNFNSRLNALIPNEASLRTACFICMEFYENERHPSDESPSKRRREDPVSHPVLEPQALTLLQPTSQ